MPAVRFEAELTLAGRTTTMVRCPFDVRATFGRARPPVLVTIGEHTYRATTAIFDDAWFLPVPADARDAVGIGPGDTVQLTVEEDAAPPVVDAETRARRAAAASRRAQARLRARRRPTG